MSTALFDLDEFEETRVEWVPLYKPFGITLASLVAGIRCRDCGTDKTSGTSGSRRSIGSFDLCEACTDLDRCLTREHSRGAEWHVSRWGSAHRADEHDELVAAQSKRRAAYLRKVKR